MKDLNQIRNEILESERKVKEIGMLKRNLQMQKYQYYLDYFNAERKEYEKLEDIPPIAYFYNNGNIGNYEIHPLSEYSNLNIITISKFFIEQMKKDYNVDISFFIKNIGSSYDHFHDGGVECTYQISIPHLIYTTNNNNANTLNDVRIELDNYKASADNEYRIKGTYPYDDRKVYYSPYCKLISDHVYGEKNDLVFDYKDYMALRDIIYNLAYFQKQHNIKQMPDKDLVKVYKRIYKD